MSYKLKSESFRKEIRRHQLDEIFQSKRLKLMSGYSQKMEAEEPCFVKKEDLETMNLLNIAKLSQTKSGTDILNEANYSQHIIKFLSSKYLNTLQQYYTSYILCNKSVYEKTPPPIQHVTMILELLEEVTDQKVTECLLDTIANTISEFQVIKEDLVRKFELADRIIAIFGRFQSPAITLCQTVLNCIIHMLNHSEPHLSFKKLRQILLRFLTMVPKKQTEKIIKKAACSFRYLTKMFPMQLLDFLIKGKVFQRFFELYDEMKDISFAHFTFNTVEYILNDMKDTDFRRLIVPFIESLSNSNFFINITSKINSFTIKQQAYHLIYKALETRKIQSNTFVICDLGKRMLQEFEVQENQEIRILFMDIFTTVYFDISNQQVKNSIERSMHRMRQLDQKDIRVASHIDQLSINFHH